MNIGVSETDYPTPEQNVAFYKEVLQRVRAVPGVEDAGAIDDLPLEGGSNQRVRPVLLGVTFGVAATVVRRPRG